MFYQLKRGVKMNERDYKGYTVGQYYKNGGSTKAWFAELDGVEVITGYSTLTITKHRINELIRRGQWINQASKR